MKNYLINGMDICIQNNFNNVSTISNKTLEIIVEHDSTEEYEEYDNRHPDYKCEPLPVYVYQELCEHGL